MKKISIVVPVYNAAEWLGETIESVLNQTYGNFELLMVDDSSPDNSADIIHSYMEKDERVKYIKKENGGVSSARNLGIEMATGEYIAFLDSDDIALPEMYGKLIENMEKNDADACFCFFTRFFKNGKTLTHREPSFEHVAKDPRDIKYFLLSTSSKVDGDVLTTDDIHGSSCRNIYKRSILIDNNIRFNENVRFAEDQLFVVSYLYCCKKVGYIDEPLLLYRAQTKPWKHHELYVSNMHLLEEQLSLIEANTLYTEKEKKRLCAYCKYSIYMAVINEDLMFKNDAYKIIKSYGKNFSKLLTFGGLKEKMKIKFDFKKIILFFMLKLHMYKLVQKTFPNKKY